MRSTGTRKFERVDYIIAGLLSLSGLVLYVYALAPNVLDGDAALFQYTPYVFGVTYPTGYPTYILLGRLWAQLLTLLLPLGNAAWRMNLFSAVCAAGALGVMYLLGLRVLSNRAGAAFGVALFGTLPTYFRWATEAKIYGLHILLLSLVLLMLTCEKPRYLAAAILYGLALGNHSTTILLLPGLALMVWLHDRALFRDGRRALRLLPALVLPPLLYLYVPIRAEWLLAGCGSLEGVSTPVAEMRGLVADFYHPGLAGLVRYFTAADFTGGVVTNWGLVPGQLFTVYVPLLVADFSAWGALMGAAGGAYLAWRNPRRFWPLFLVYAALIPFVLTYGQGEQSAFLLPSDFAFALFAGGAIALGAELAGRARAWAGTATSALLLLTAMVIPVEHASYGAAWLKGKWDDSQYRYWQEVMEHPMGEGAGVMAHWGDLTGMWYMQHTQGARPDVYGLYPPTDAGAVEWLESGRELYIAGPLQGRAETLAGDYRLVSWGRLIRVAPPDSDPASMLPSFGPPGDSGAATFGGRLSLMGVRYPAIVESGGDFPFAASWQTIGEIPADANVSLRLVDEWGGIAAQFNDRLVSMWFPAPQVGGGEVLLSSYPFILPEGMLPGEYRLEISVYVSKSEPWPTPGGEITAECGTIRVTPSAPGHKLRLGELKEVRGASFGGEIRLEGYRIGVTRVRQGRDFTVYLLWRAAKKPRADYTLLVELVDAGGSTLRAYEHDPVDGRAPTGGWERGQAVLDSVDVVVPAGAPPGEDALWVRVSWLGPGGEKLPVRRFLSSDDGVTVGAVRVVERERSYETPEMGHTLDADFGGKILLLGCDLPLAEVSPGGSLEVTYYHRALAEMEEGYAIFNHIVDGEGRVVGQWDGLPGFKGKEPTTGWLPGEVVASPFAIPVSAGAPPGEYLLISGLYLPPDGPRLPVLDENGDVTGDYVEVAKVLVK